ncbi:Lipopolysaccharide export system ATP-binding protein LptB [Saezia sanguinis]|uniref:Lipopolysaccharide export system ATP-binding protein LptB n=2 Tax=Saezia sanguinis TaxID=1965230 RepID=A0A433SFE5_9BURK|nr:Lipopolysaccharide export system ATP-binding protein LptB [Saezia sanguinis]
MMLQMKNITVRFGGLTANKDASLDVQKGSITGLIGPNGAGKTTLFTVASGFLKPNEGQVLFNDQDITALPPYKRASMGMARTFQIVQPFAGLTTLENITIGAYLRHTHRDDAFQKAREVGIRVGLEKELNRPASGLTISGRKRLELARALATEPQLILLDEVLAGLNPSEIKNIIPVIQDIRASGVTVFMIEHVMQAVVSLCDYVYVLSQGQLIAQGTSAQVVADPHVIEAYLGHGAAARLAEKETQHA